MALSSDDQSTRLRLRPTFRLSGLLLAGLFLWSMSLASGCSQPETRQTRSGAETATNAGEATRNQPSPVQYRTNISDAGVSSDNNDGSGEPPERDESESVDAGSRAGADTSIPTTPDAQ